MNTLTFEAHPVNLRVLATNFSSVTLTHGLRVRVTVGVCDG